MLAKITGRGERNVRNVFIVDAARGHVDEMFMCAPRDLVARTKQTCLGAGLERDLCVCNSVSVYAMKSLPVYTRRTSIAITRERIDLVEHSNIHYI